MLTSSEVYGLQPVRQESETRCGFTGCGKTQDEGHGFSRAVRHGT